MEIFKPLSVSLLMRPIEYRQRFGLSVSVMTFFPFSADGNGPLFTEMAMWDFLAANMTVPVVDVGITKTTGEYLVFGSAFPPGGEAPGCAVRAKVGPLSKTLLVFGDRYWDGSQATRPIPFASMPVDWEHAYGGPDFPHNPLGKGRAKVDFQGSKLQPLPNVEIAAQRASRPDVAVPPSGFGIVDAMWPQRAQLRGTYDEAWFKEHSPAFAPDLNWKHFNVAPQDQWFQGLPTGREEFEFENMHPEKAVVRGTLPSLRARIFCYVKRSAGPQMREVPMSLTTLVFFPAAERCVAIHHGMLQTRTDDASDVLQMMAALEHLDEPRPDEHYAQVLERRSDPENGALWALRERDLVPAGRVDGDPDFEVTKADYKVEGFAAQAALRKAQLQVRQIRAQLTAQGMDPDAMNIKEPKREKDPTPDELADFLIAKKQENLANETKAMNELADRLEAEKARAEEEGRPLPPRQTKRGPPTYRAVEELVALSKKFPPGATGPDGELLLDLPTLLPKLQQVEQAERLGYLQGAHFQLPVDPMDFDKAAETRDAVLAAHAGKQSFRGADLTGADLSGLDLRRADFTGAWLENVDFRNTNLSRAIFTHAVLAHARFRGSVAIAANFDGANLGRADIDGAVFDYSSFVGTTLMYTAFAGSSFLGATLTNAQLLDTAWGASDWTNAQASGQLFIKRDLKGMVFAGANLAGATFVECDVAGVDFADADLSDASFVGCKGARARFLRAKMERTVFVQNSDFSAADFAGATMPNVNLRGTRVDGARFVKSVMEMGDLSEASARGADFSGAAAVGALMMKTDLRGATARGMNLMNAVLQNADLRGTDLAGSNFFGADLSRVRLDTSTVLQGSEFKRARTHPRYREPAGENA